MLLFLSATTYFWLVTHSAVWPQLVELRGSKLKCPHTKAVHAVEWLVLFSVGDVL